MEKDDAIALIKQAIQWCHMRDLPETKASFCELLEILDVAAVEQLPDDPALERPH